MATQQQPAAGDYRWPLPPPPGELKYYTRKRVPSSRPTASASGRGDDLAASSAPPPEAEAEADAAAHPPPRPTSQGALVVASTSDDGSAAPVANGHDSAVDAEWRRVRRRSLFGDLERVRALLKLVEAREREVIDTAVPELEVEAAAHADAEPMSLDEDIVNSQLHITDTVNSMPEKTEPEAPVVSSVPPPHSGPPPILIAVKPALLPSAPVVSSVPLLSPRPEPVMIPVVTTPAPAPSLALVPPPPPVPAPPPVPVVNRKPLTVAVAFNENDMLAESFEKEKRTPKANQYYRNEDFLLAKDKFPPVEYTKKINGNKKHNYGFRELGPERRIFANAFKKCSSLLAKLMKHKHGWVFNQPVDTVTLGCYDYFDIIKNPMDFGTIKGKMSSYWNPREFADDVRLTFRNAMTYNPKGHPVHTMAEELSEIFESGWLSIEAEIVYVASYAPSPRKLPLLPAPPPLEVRIPERPNSTMHASAYHTPVLHTAAIQTAATSVTPSLTPRVPTYFPHINRAPAMTKPKAKDLYKREMTFDEKRKLSQNLQNLPAEKLEIVVQIIKSKNLSVSQLDDKIEVDIDEMDTETLWELDRFVMNYKKNLSKHKRKAERAMLAALEAEQRAQQVMQSRALITMPNATLAGISRDDAVPATALTQSAPAQEVQKGEKASQSGNTSSSSSDSGSSSSSDSDSDSSSGSDGGQSH